VQQIFEKAHQAAKISVSGSQESTDTDYQPGEALMAALSPPISQIHNAGSDKLGLVIWEYVEIVGNNDHQIVIFSAFHVGKYHPSIDNSYSLLQPTTLATHCSQVIKILIPTSKLLLILFQ